MSCLVLALLLPLLATAQAPSPPPSFATNPYYPIQILRPRNVHPRELITINGTPYQTNASALWVDWTNHFSLPGGCNATSGICANGTTSYEYRVTVTVDLDPGFGTYFPTANCSSGPSGITCQPCETVSLAGTNQTYVDSRSCLWSTLRDLDSLSTSLSCTECLKITLGVSIQACSGTDPGTCSAEQLADSVRYSGARPVISPLVFPKLPYASRLWYSNVTGALFSANIANAECSWIVPTNVDLRISLSGYADDDLPNLFDNHALLESTFMPPALTFQAFLLTFSGDPYQGEPYDFTLEVMSGTGASATSTATLYLDNTPPVAGYARFSELVVNEAAQTAKVVVTGYQDPESGIKELWTRVGGDSSVCAPDFGSSASWVNFTNLTMSTIVNSPLADQTIAVDLSQALQNNWTEVHFAVAVINHAWTNPGDNGVTYACPNTLLVDRTRAKLDITRISAVGDTATAGWSNESSVEVHWLASNVVAGIAFVTANLSVPGLPVATAGPFYDKSASLDIAAGGSIPANTSFTVCMNATSNSMPPIIVSTCKSTILPLARAFDQSCVQTGVTYHPLADGNSNAQGSIWANWTSCTISDNASIGYWLISSTDFRLADHGFASVNDGGVVIAFGPLWPSSSYKFCFTSVATTDFVGQNFCTSSILVDPIPPRPVGGIIDAYAGRGVDVNALAIVSSSNTAEYLVRWDAWSEPPSGIQEFHVNLVGSSQVVANASISDNNGATYAYLFQNLSLEVGQSYYASLSAINHARLESTAIRSRGISITTQNTGSPQVQVTGGTRVQQNGQSLLLFRARNETSITVEWSGFVGMSAQKPTYLVQLAPASPSTTIMPYTITTAQQDLVMAVPGLSGFYTLSVTATAPDGTSRSVAYKYKLWISGVGPSPPSTLYCDVDFSKLDPVKRTVPFSASWSPGPDPGQLLVSQTLAFRRAGSNTSTSSATSLDLLATATSTSVSYLYGAPTLLDQYSIECVYEARDLSGSVTRAIYNGTTHDSLSAFNPTVLALSSAAQVSQPSSTTDFEYFEDVSVTSNGIFSVGLQAFPDIFRNGVQVASLSYSVHWLPENDSSITPGAIGTVDVSPTAEGVEFIVPPTAVDVRSKGFAQYKVLLGSALLPINVFFPSQFLANGGFPSDLSTLFICATVTTWSTNGTVSACNNGIMRDSLPPVAGIVSINATAAGGTLYLIDASSVAVSWAGFSKTNWPYLGETGISQFKWGIGSKAGVDDYVSFATVPGSETSVTADISVENGATLYATVVGYDYVGRAVSAISPLAVVDNTPPVSANSSCQVLSKVNANGSTFVRVSFPPWRDDESGVTSIVWIVETAYGTEDILPRQTATFSTVVFANLPLQPGVAYLARVIATNGAGLSAEIVESFTTASPVKLLYLVDGPDPSQNKLFDNQPSKYTVSWSFAGTVVDFVLGIGTTPRQDDIASFKRTNSSLQTLTVPLHINDGARVFATIFIQDSGGHFQSFVSPGMIVDSSPPIRGWVTVGGLQVHRMTLPRQSVISASWIGFSDPESDINQYEYCLDLNDDIKNPPCAIAGWVNTHTNLQVVDAPIAGAMLPVGRRCFVKVRATNNAGLAIIATSPPFNVDPAIPQGGRASISFPGEDGGNDISPLARDSSQLYIDSSCVKVSWSSFTGNIEKYRVAVLQAPGTMVVPFVSVGTLTNWTFAGLDLATQGPGSQYLAVVQAWTAAGLYSEITTPFKVVQGLPGAGTVTVVSTFATGVTFYLTGFADLNGLAVQYEISIGKNPYGADGPPKLLPDCGSPPCSYTRDVSFGTAPSGTVFFLTVRAQNEAGLFSPSATVPVTLSMPMAHGVSVQRGIPFLWNLTATSPFLNVYQTNAVLTGTNLTNFMSDPNTAVFLTCNFSNTITKVEVVTTGRLQVIGGDVAHPVITCPAPYNEAVDGGYLSLQVQISNALSNPVVFWRRDIVTDWNSTTPQCGLYFVPSSPFRVTSAVTVITWNTKARANVGFFKIKSGNDMLPQIWPASTRKATVFATTPMTTSPMKFSVCAYFIGTSEANARCVDTSPIRVNVVPPSINPQISSNKLGPLSATVRVTTAPNLLPLGTSQYVGPTPVTVAWDGTFIGDGSKSIIKYYVLLGTAPMTATNGTMLATAATTASLTSNLVAGVPYFATVIAVDEVGLTTIAYSSAVIPEISPPDIGTVHIGKNFLPTDIAWQAGSSSIDFYLKGWTDHISGIYEFACRVCSAGSCGPRMTLGIAVSNSIPVNLTAGVPYWVSVQAVNGAGLATDWVNSSTVTVDAQAPKLQSVGFSGVNQNFAAFPLSDLALTWQATVVYAPLHEYTIQIGTKPGGGQILPPTNVGTQVSFSLATLPMTHNATIYATVRALSENGLESFLVSDGLRLDFTAPLVVAPLFVLSGSVYVLAAFELNVTVSWDGVFLEPESQIVQYEWAIGTAGLPALYTGEFLDAGLSVSASYVCTPADNSHFVVTVRATNSAGVKAVTSSLPILKSATPPSEFTISALNEGTTVLDGTWFIHSSIGRFSLDSLTDPVSGLQDVQIQVLNATSNATLCDWLSVGVTTRISLEADASWLFQTLQLNARAVNNVGLTTTASTPVFVMNATRKI